MSCLKCYTELYAFNVVWREEEKERDEPCKWSKHLNIKVLSFKVCIKVGMIAWLDLFCGSFMAYIGFNMMVLQPQSVTLL